MKNTKSKNIIQLTTEPIINGSGLINIKDAAKFLHCHRSKIEKLIETKYFGAVAGRNGGKLLNLKQIIEFRDLITHPNYPENVPLKHKHIIIDLFNPIGEIL